ncbi:hypothetical protein G6F65_013809 [Rhizopus arrhizus]|nr:hypothetical protein G6F65_013809 [Rhizopus arrhizus]
MKRLILSTLTAAILGASAAASADNLTIGFADPLSSLDPQLNNHAGDRSVALHFWDLLIENKWNKLQPGLAVSWKPLDDTTWEFKLREGVKWQDGTPFTADDLIYSYTRARAVPGSVATYAGYLRTIDTMTAKDPLTLIVKTKAPNPDLPLNLASVHVVSKHGGEKSTTEDYNSGKAVIGTGPYKFVSWKRGAEFVLARNDNYWGKKPEWDRVVYRPISNAAARVAALLAGDVDMIEDPPTDDLPKLKGDKKLYVEETPSVRVVYVALDQYAEPSPGIQGTDKNPMKDKRVREALSLAINRDALVERVMGGVALPAGNLLPYPMVGSSKEHSKAPKADVEKAKALLKEAGYPNGFSITLGSPSGRYVNDSKVAQAIASMWTRIGVKTSVDAMAPPVFFKNRDSYAFSAYLAGWSVTSGEMSNALTSLLVTRNPEAGLGTTNRSRYSNPKMDELVKEASSTMDDAKRADLLAKASNIAMDDYAMLPVHFELSVWAMKGDIRYQGRPDQVTLAQFATLKK